MCWAQILSTVGILEHFLTVEKPVGFLKLEMCVVFKDENLYSGFAQLERGREVDLNNQKKKKNRPKKPKTPKKSNNNKNH